MSEKTQETKQDVAQVGEEGSGKPEALIGDQQASDASKVDESAARIAALEAELAAANVKLEGAEAELRQLAQSMLDHASKVEAEIAALTAERDVLAAKVAKIDAEPKARKGKAAAKPRKCGPVEDQPTPDELLALISMASTVELVFSDGEKELPFERRMIDGPAWSMTAVGLQLRLPEFIVVGPASGPVNLAGYGLFLDGSQVAYSPRMDVLDVQPGRRMDLRSDVVFRAA